MKQTSKYHILWSGSYIVGGALLLFSAYALFIFLVACAPDDEYLEDSPAVRRLLEMPETSVVPPGTYAFMAQYIDGRCDEENPAIAQIISHFGTNNSPDQITTFYRQNFIRLGWKEAHNQDGDTIWTRGNFHTIILKFVEAETYQWRDTSKYRYWYRISINDNNKNDNNKTETDC